MTHETPEDKDFMAQHIKVLQKEIKFLREELIERAGQRIEEYTRLKLERDEWKRRAETLWEAHSCDAYGLTEATKWFEEKDDE